MKSTTGSTFPTTPRSRFDDGEWATYRVLLPYAYYQELRATIELAMKMGAPNEIEALSFICAEYRSTWEASERDIHERNEDDPMFVARRYAFERDNWTCLMRDCESRANLTVHHVTPLSMGGARYDVNNLATLCMSCHERITHGTRETNWKAELPYLLGRIQQNQKAYAQSLGRDFLHHVGTSGED